jgi:hypothetical protein
VSSAEVERDRGRAALGEDRQVMDVSEHCWFVLFWERVAGVISMF